MNKILNNFEAASTGKYEASKSETSDMKMILESFYDVAKEDAGDSVPQPQQLDEIASVTMSGDSADEVARLARLMNGSDQPEPTGYQGPPDMPPQEPAMVTPRVMDDIELGDEEPVEEESWDNEPEARYDDHHKMTKDLSGGLNRQKKSYPPTNGGDNPMALETSLAEELSAMLKQKMSEQDQDGDGDEDFADVQIARMVASGMSKEEAKKKVKDKDYNEDVDVAEDDDPCWKNYKMVGTKKKNGKEVPNCVPKESIEEKAKPDYVDLDKDGDKKEPMKKAAKDKKKKESEVEEAGKLKGGGDDPCWKGYKMVGTKKKGGKEVPNCVPRDESVEFDNAPVFEAYVKPFLDKSPKQMVEFYDREAGNIIDRLSIERRNLAEKGENTAVHEAIIGKLREGLGALPEETLTEIRRRGYRSPYRGGWSAFPSSRERGAFVDKSERDRDIEWDEKDSDDWMKRSRTRKSSRAQQKGKFNIRIQGKVVKDKEGNPFQFSSEQSAQKAADTMSKKDWNQGKKVEVIKVM